MPERIAVTKQLPIIVSIEALITVAAVRNRTKDLGKDHLPLIKN